MNINNLKQLFEGAINNGYVPTEREMEAYMYLFNTPNTETPPLERYEITGDVYESETPLNPAKKKQENDHDKEEPEEPTKH